MASVFFKITSKIETKTCNKCGKNKPLSDFGWHSGAGYRRPECKNCNNKLSKDRANLRKSSPKIPKNHICPICNKKEDVLEGRGGKKCPAFVLDHDHMTNKFRGYLCQSCNRALGTFNTIELLKSAAEYLKKH